MPVAGNHNESLTREDSGFGVPIALFNFNRPHLTRQVFEVVRQIRPRKLLLVADGPRASRADDERLCTEVRAVFDDIDWDCEVLQNFSDTNLGSFKRNSSGLNWVFDNVEEAIILEDDCVPDLSFFPYCEVLLGKYREDTRIGLISGNNFLQPIFFPRRRQSYFFSGYALTWGWASWRRVWKEVNLTMPYWPHFLDSGELRRTVFSSKEEKYWKSIFGEIHAGARKNAWDYQLILTCMRLRLLTIVPSVNLVSNIGYGPDATHCKDTDSLIGNTPARRMKFPLAHPKKIQASLRQDYRIFLRRFYGIDEYVLLKWKKNVIRFISNHF